MTKGERRAHSRGTERGASQYDPLKSQSEAQRDQSYIKTIKPKSPGQEKLLTTIDNHALVLALGPAGTGKTYLSIAKAVDALESGKVGRIVLSRPAVEAGESIGFLPGEMENKLAPYLRPLYDALSDRLSMKRVRALMTEGAIEIAPIGFMRGRTLNNAFIVVDEAQNLTFPQLKMVLTRLGWNSTMVVTGDPDQSDLAAGNSGLADIAAAFKEIRNIGVVQLKDKDIVRHPLVAEMLGVLNTAQPAREQEPEPPAAPTASVREVPRLAAG